MAKKYGEYDPDILRRLQMIELDMLSDIDAFCEKHGIDYFVHYGCAIGAVRHKGFIPWDDDIDICMLRADCERFVQLAQADKAFSEEYEILAPPDKKCPIMFPKICKRGTLIQTMEMKQADLRWGIGIDIFPLDVVPEDLKASLRKSRQTALLAKLQFLYFFKDPHVPGDGWKAKILSAGCYVTHHLLRIFPLVKPERLQKRYLEICKMEKPQKDSMYVAYSTVFNHEKRKMRYEDYFPSIRMPFEHTTIRMPNQYDKVLRGVFGDYMQIPPVEKRVNHAPEVLDFGDK